MAFDIDTDDTFQTTDSHPDDYETVNESSAVYADEEQARDKGRQLYGQPGDSSDEVDPRKLLRDPTLSEIRWYYRREMGGTICKKPIKDAFKNDFDITGTNADEARRLLSEPDFNRRHSFIDAHMMAEFKSRRDGFALLFIGTTDSTEGLYQSPVGDDVEVEDITHLEVLTVDDLTGSNVTGNQITEGTGLENGEYQIRDTGIVVNRDPTSRDFNNPVGYVLGTEQPQFIHRDRIIHYVWNGDVDGDYDGGGIRRFDYDHTTLGEWEGDSVLMPSYDLLKGLAKGNWAIMQALFRHASHMYDVELPTDANEEDLEAAIDVTRNINAKSALVVPDGYDVTQHDSGNEMDPQSHYDVIFSQICANHEMTKSVLFGTQTGTVSGSETDIKNYFNKVERYRTNRGESKIAEYLTQAKRILDGRTERNYEFDGYDIDWGPLFKLDRDARMNMFQTQAGALSALIGSYVVTPDEARAIMSEEWSYVDFDDLSEEQMDILDRIRLATSGQGEQAIASEGEYTNAPATGGRPEGAQQESEPSEATPNGDSRTDDSNGLDGNSG